MQFGFPSNQININNNMNNNIININNNINNNQVNNNINNNILFNMNSNMPNVAGGNQINNMYQMNYNFPMKGVNNYSLNCESSYANSVLISLAGIDCIKDWINRLNDYIILNNPHFLLTREFYKLLNCLYSGQKGDSSYLIPIFEQKYFSLKNKELERDPYHFLFYFLEIIHSENNNPINPNFDSSEINNPSIQNMQNDNYMYNLFGSYFQQALNSVVSQNFYNINKYSFNCQICNPVFLYKSKKIICFEVNQYRIFRDQCMSNRIGMNLNIEECFKCYSGGYPSQCGCGSIGTGYNNIISTTKVLIIYFKRDEHVINCDIDFNSQMMFLNKKYILKACISYCNMPKYFADIFINKIWYRFMDDQIKVINESEIHQYEPQLLIYELEDFKSFQVNFQNTINNSNNQLFLNPFNYCINQMMNNNSFNNISFINPYQYQQMMIKQQQQQQQQMIESAKLQQNLMMFQKLLFNSPLLNKGPNNINNSDESKSNQNSNISFINLPFFVVPKNWDKDEKNVTHRIMAQVTSEDTIEKAIDNFFIKLQKPREAIIEFKLKDNVLDAKSQEKLKDNGIDSNSRIIATQSDNFNELSLFKNNNENNQNKINENNNDDNNNIININITNNTDNSNNNIINNDNTDNNNNDNN